MLTLVNKLMINILNLKLVILLEYQNINFIFHDIIIRFIIINFIYFC